MPLVEPSLWAIDPVLSRTSATSRPDAPGMALAWSLTGSAMGMGMLRRMRMKEVSGSIAVAVMVTVLLSLLTAKLSVALVDPKIPAGWVPVPRIRTESSPRTM